MKRLLAVLLFSAVSACGLIPAMHQKPDPVVARVLPPPTPRTDGAIYQAGQQVELFADLKARRVGDVLTVRLTEENYCGKQHRADGARQDHHDVGRADFHHDPVGAG
jgi:flagellar L-ring protein precursor FlgH